ncbi:hypothetical protein, partial [Klebsiella pneumoniae]|uniref:hypothetical protein n=1 Tax=Klebsiella pneumoniae TaxID=573 RepID=UPI003968D5BF
GAPTHAGRAESLGPDPEGSDQNRLTISRLVSRQAAISTRYLPFHVILHANTSDGPMIDTLTPGDAL